MLALQNIPKLIAPARSATKPGRKLGRVDLVLPVMNRRFLLIAAQHQSKCLVGGRS